MSINKILSEALYIRTFQHLNAPHTYYRSGIYLPRKAHHHQEQSV